MNRLTFVLLILAGGLVLLAFNAENGRTLGIANDDFARLVALLPFVTVLGASLLIGHRYPLGKVARDLLVWLVIALGLVVVWLYRGDLQVIGNRVLAALMPGRAVVSTSRGGTTEIILSKAMNGHFQADVEINGQSVSMLVDTGASSVSLSWEDAYAVGLNPQNLVYSETVMTANGRARAAPVTLAVVSLGPIQRRNVPALVATQGRLDQSLLGMSFLSTLGSLRMQADELRLED